MSAHCRTALVNPLGLHCHAQDDCCEYDSQSFHNQMIPLPSSSGASHLSDGSGRA